MENLCIFSQNAESANIGVVVPHLFLKYLICLNRILQYKMYTLIYYKWLKKKHDLLRAECPGKWTLLTTHTVSNQSCILSTEISLAKTYINET